LELGMDAILCYNAGPSLRQPISTLTTAQDAMYFCWCLKHSFK